MFQTFENICGSTFWDSKLTWNNNNPYFTKCFEESVLSWIAPCFLLIFAPLEIYFYSKSNLKNIPWSILNISKLSIAIILTLIQGVILGEVFHEARSEASQIYPIQIITPLVRITSYGLYMFLLLMSTIKGTRGSVIHFIFWFLLLGTSSIQLRTILSPPDYISSNVTTIYYIGSIVSFFLISSELVLSLLLDVDADYERPNEKACPKKESSFLSILLFSWFTPIIIKGYKKPLEYSDLWDLSSENSCNTLVPKFNREWSKEENKKLTKNLRESRTCLYSKLNNKEEDVFTKLEESTKSKSESSYNQNKKYRISLFKVLFKIFGRDFVSLFIMRLLPDLVFTFLSPQILKLLINFVSKSSRDEEVFAWRGYLYAILLFIIATMQSFMYTHYFQLSNELSMRVKTILINAIYRKSLLISNSAKKTSSGGEIVNLMAVDVQSIIDRAPMYYLLWTCPIQVIICMYFLWGILGHSVFIGLTVIILMIPTNAFIVRRAKKLHNIQMKFKDRRIKTISEFLSGIKVLKLNAWEPSFEKKISEIRNNELKILKEAAILNAITSFLSYFSPHLLAICTFAFYVLIDENNVLDAEVVFVSLSYFNIINKSLSFLPIIITASAQASVCTKRITNFLNSEEINEKSVTQNATSEYSIEIKNGTFTWDMSLEPALQSINLKIKPGSLVAIVGTVGSGKSSLLLTILGELEKVTGSVDINGKIAYVAQQAWIQNATFKSNITYGNEFNQKVYDKVIHSCALTQDLEILPAGDRTEIGEKGINLSGGQKQRISLARAIYNDGDIYLLDDPLSAVDTHVGKHIFDNVVGPKGCLSSKTRLLVTHSISYLPQVDQIIVVKNGKISEIGAYDELLRNEGDFSDFLNEHALSSEAESATSSNEKIKKSSKSSKVKEETRTKLPESDKNESDKNRNRRGDESAIIKIETSETASVKFSIYLEYFAAGGLQVFTFTFFLYAVYQGLVVLSSIWLSKWSDVPPTINGTQNSETRDFYLGVYGGIGVLQAITNLFASYLLGIYTLKSAGVLHSRMLKRVIRAPMSFFDTTPLGRIVNRFSKDIDTCDNSFPNTIRLWLSNFLQVSSILIIISYATPIFIPFIIPIGIVYYFIQRIFVCSSRQLKRIDSVTRSPIFSHFSETLAGAITIRAFKQQSRFINEAESRVDYNHVAYYISLTANRWLSIRLETIGNLIILFAAIFAVFSRDSLDPGLMGLSISNALTITISLNLLVRWTSDLEANIVSVERVKEYTEIPVEADWLGSGSGKDQVDDKWPENGEIEFLDYETRYREGLDNVLHKVNFKINPGEKIGVVGRTGAGKSSLSLALFRLIEASGGVIKIDGKDISNISLENLRNRLTIIPQDPVLFSGTLRNNLDPFETHSDEEIRRAIELSHLKTFVSTLPNGLDYLVSESGDNLSVGQKQLACLARALLRKTKILILDEPTAAVDLETDKIIQKTIREEFSNSTVITIAHRINTILDSTRVMVLDNGKIVEFDSPTSLMAKKDSNFYSLAKDTAGGSNF